MQPTRAEGAAVYVSPNHPEYERLQGAGRPSVEPPEPQVELVASFERKGIRGGPDQELRLVLDEYNGRAFLSLRLWTKDREGRFWAVKGKGVSVRLSEAEGLCEALETALDLAMGRDGERGT